MVKDQLLGYIGRDTTLEPPPLSTTVSVWQSAANCFNLHSKWVDVCCCGVCTWDCDARVSLHLQPLPISTMLQSAKKSCLHNTVCELRKDKILYAKVEVKMKDVFEWKTSSTLSYSKQANRQRLLSNPKKKEKEGKTFICFKPSSWGITKASPPLLSNSFFYTESFSANAKRDLTFVFWVFFTIPGFIPKTHRAGE